jgi:uncharacterized protein YraI
MGGLQAREVRRRHRVLMSKRVVSWLGAVATLFVLLGMLLIRPGAVLATTSTVAVDTSLYDAPPPDAHVVATLPAGTVVSIAGPPTADFYPVTAGNVSGWLQGELLDVDKDAVEAANERPVGSDPTAAQPREPVGMDLATNASQPGSGVPHSADRLQETLATPVNSPPATEPAGAATESPVLLAEPGPSGPARVKVDTSVRAGPGPDFDRLGRAAKGSTVEQTGHLIDGYVTVQTGEVTGWVPLDHLAPADQDETTPGA